MRCGRCSDSQSAVDVVLIYIESRGTRVACQFSHSPPVVLSSHGRRHGWMIIVMHVSGDVAAHVHGGGVKHTAYKGS